MKNFKFGFMATLGHFFAKFLVTIIGLVLIGGFLALINWAM